MRSANLFLASVLLFAVGCGSGLGTVPVTGKVTLDGEPVEGAMVVFNADSADGRSASGMTDASGAYVLTTEFNGDGALPGSYKVAVSKFEGGDDGMPDTTGMSEDEAMDAMYGALDKKGRNAPVAKNLIAKKWSNEAGSGLTATVTDSGPNEFNFEVTSK